MGSDRASELVCRLEAHAVDAWPATITERIADGWTLRATPGLDRGRSNHALPPCRSLTATEIEVGLERATEFAARHEVHLGIQVSPLELHGTLQAELDQRGFLTRWPVVVMTAPVPEAPTAPPPGLELADHATPEWLSAWRRCEGRDDVDAHASTVLRLLAGRAQFARLGAEAVAIAVPGDGVLGLFSIAVDPARRRRGLGTTIVQALMRGHPGSTAYLQVEERNAAAIAMYRSLHFVESYRYCHRTAA